MGAYLQLWRFLIAPAVVTNCYSDSSKIKNKNKIIINNNKKAQKGKKNKVTDNC